MSGPEQGMPEPSERLRRRVVALVADALPAVTPLPATLKRVAAFAPNRRARLGESAIWAALDADEFRRSAATQVAGQVGDRGHDVLDDGALAWLQRDDGWQDVVHAAESYVVEQAADGGRVAEEVERLQARVGALQSEVRELKAAHRAAADESREENGTLRRRLGQSRAAHREVEARLEETQAALDRAGAQALLAAERHESDLRRVRDQLGVAEAGASALRRESRSERDAATLRARYLLDTVVDAANGLRRELALPAAEGTPGAQVEAGLEGVDAPRTTTAPLNREAFEQLLSMPRARLIIDGYNLTKSVWGSATLEAQRSRLVAALAPLVGRTGTETTVVFDAAEQTSRPVVPTPRGIKVVFSPPGVIADDVIRSLVSAEPVGRVVLVVSSDQEVARGVTRSGARAVPSAVLADVIRA